MRVTCIYHSGFLVETERCCLLFDYYKRTLPEIRKPLYIFASHSHRDHYVPEIHRIGDAHPGTRYFLSSDIPVGPGPGITLLGPGEEVSAGDVAVRTLASTDRGVAFWVQVDGRSLFHAGDLNLWLWGEHDTPREAEEMRSAFLAAAEPLRGAHLDAAFLPLDPRQGEGEYWQGLDYFARLAEIDHIFPMHYWQKYSVIQRFLALDCALPYADKVIQIKGEGESYEI